MEKATTAQLKQQNRKNVFDFIYRQKKTCKQDIAGALELSLPTVSLLLKELHSSGLIEKKGTFASSGGRRPDALCVISDGRVAIGAEVTKHHLQLVCVDLYGLVVTQKRIRLLYQNNTSYYETVGQQINTFAGSIKNANQRILGVGIAIQGVISADGQYVTYGKILNCTGVSVSDFAQFIDYPCALLHDSESAAKAELWYSGNIQDAIYISLSKHLGSAVIIGGKLHKGEGTGSGLLEHMILQPGGRPCYCGKCGCLETYCSTNALFGEEDAERFFQSVLSGNENECRRWDNYLDILSSAIDNLHMLIDCEVILGGHIGPYLTTEDLRNLNDMARQKCAFPEQRSYIRVGQCPAAVVAIGAGLRFIGDFLSEI